MEDNLQNEISPDISTESMGKKQVSIARSEYYKNITAKVRDGKTKYERIDIAVKKGTCIFALIGACALFAIMILAFANVVTTKIFRYAITNSTELITYCLPVMVYTSLPAVITGKNGLLSADILSSRFGPLVEFILETFGSILSIGVFVLLAWRSFVNFSDLFTNHTVNMVSANSFVIWPFGGIMFLGLAICVFCLIYRYARSIYRFAHRKNSDAVTNPD